VFLKNDKKLDRLKQYKLSNGANLIVEELADFPVVAVQAWVGVGSADEIIPQEAGISHVIEHMLFKGTEKRRVGQVASEIEGTGGSLNAWTSFDETVYHMVLPSNRWKLGLDSLTDVLLNSKFDEEELKKEKEVILEELNHSENSAAHITSDNMFSMAYGSHPYGSPIIGTRESIKAFTSDSLKKYCSKWYNPSNFTFVVVGSIDGKDVKKELERLLKGVPSGKKPRNIKPEFTPPDSAVKVAHGPFREAYLDISIPLKNYDSKYSAAVDMISMILGDGESSRIQVKLKHSMELVLESYAWAYTPKDRGLFAIGAVLPPENVVNVTKEIGILLNGLSSITKEELDKVKIILKSEEIELMQTVQGVARKRGSYNRVAGDPSGDIEYIKAIESMTLDDLHKIVKEIVGSNRYLSLTLPDDKKISKASLKKALVSTPKIKKPSVKKIEKDRVKRYKFKNGATLLVMEEKSLPFISMRCGWVGGLLTENIRNSGISPLQSMVLQRGTMLRDGDSLHRRVEERGGTLLSYAGRNSFGLRVDTLTEFWEENFDLLMETLLYPAWSEIEIDKAKLRLLESLIAEKDRHSTQVLRLFEQSIYGKTHPYGLNISGRENAIKGFTKNKLVNWWNKHYNLSNIVFTAVGDINGDKVYDHLAYIMDGKTKETSSWSPSMDVISKPIKPYVYKHADISQNHILLGAPGVSLESDDRFPMDIMARLLSGQSGRLFLDLRDKHSLAYSVSAFSLEGVAPGYFTSYIVTRPEETQRAVDGLKYHLERLVKEPVHKGELERTVNYMVGTNAIGLQRRASLAASIFYGELYGIGYDSYLKYQNELEKVTADDIQRVAKKYLTEDKFVLSIYGPKGI
jgi:zinc protease